MGNVIKSKLRYTTSTYFSGALAARLADEMVGPFVLWLSLSLFHSPARGANILALLTFGAVIGGSGARSLARP